MNAQLRLTFLLVIAAIATHATAQTQRQLHEQVRVEQKDALKIALAHVPPHSVVQSVELEQENGRVVWSYDIKVPKTSDITEVQVDAKTGEIVDQHTETRQTEAAEKAAEQHSH